MVALETDEPVLRCSIDGKRIAYLRDGDGEPALLIHGITTYSFIWRKIFPHLTPQFDVIAPDLLGCGKSDKPLDVDYSIKTQAAILAKFIHKLELKPAHLIAHDIGGGVAQILAVNHPDLVKDIVLINSVAYDFWPVQPIIAIRTPIIRQLTMATLDYGTLRLIVKRGLYHKDVLTDELMELFWEPMKTSLGRKAFLHLAECLDNDHLLEISEKLHRLAKPLLIIRGEADVYLSAEICKSLRENIPGSRLISIPTAGHYAMEDEPEQISEAIIKFIRGK